MTEYTRTVYPLAKVQNTDGTWRKPTKEESEAMEKILKSFMREVK